MQHYLGIVIDDHPPTCVEKHYAVLEDTLETLLVTEWPEWDRTRKGLVRTGRGVTGKNAATYRLAAIEATAEPPYLLTHIIDHAKALSPEG